MKIALDDGTQGEAATIFTIEKQDKVIESKDEPVEEKHSLKSTGPKTGDNIVLWINLILISIMGIIVTTKSSNKRPCKH